MTDWLMVIITAIYVVATIIICIYNGKSAAAAKEQTAIAQKQMKEMVDQYNAANRPVMTVRFEIIRSGLLCFVFENVGPLPAEDVKISINQEFIENISDDKDNRSLRELNNASLFIASKQKLTILLGGQIEFKKIAAVPAVITVSYNSKYQETTTIDLNQYAFMLVYTSSEEDISQHVKKMQEHNDKFHKQLVSAVETLHSPMLQSVIVHDGGDSYATKFMILKMVSLNPGIQCLTIAESIKAEKEEVLDLLLELRQLDRLVTVRPDEKESDDDYKAHWYRK